MVDALRDEFRRAVPFNSFTFETGEERAVRQMVDVDAALASGGVQSLLKSFPTDDRYDVRQDLRQELAIRLWNGKIGVEGLCTTARYWLLGELRSRKTHRQIDQELAEGTASHSKTGPNWTPTWYPPRKDAEQFAPLACKGARVMHVKTRARSVVNEVEGLMIGVIASRRGRGR